MKHDNDEQTDTVSQDKYLDSRDNPDLLNLLDHIAKILANEHVNKLESSKKSEIDKVFE